MDRYWVLGSGVWDPTDTTHWSLTSGGAGGASVPTSANNVIFDSNSGASSYTVTVNTGQANCLDFTLGNPATGVVTFAGAQVLAIYGSMSLATGALFTKTNTTFFSSTSTGKNITTNGVLINSPITFSGVAGGWTCQDNLTLATNQSITLQNGTFDTNGKTVTCYAFIISGTSTRTCTLGASTINCDVWTATTTTNLTFNANTSTINVKASSAFNGGGLTYNNVVITYTSGGLQMNLNGTNTFANLSLVAGAYAINMVIWGADQTITVNLALTGYSATNRLTIGINQGTRRTITAAAVTAQYVDIDMTAAAGAANWNLSAITGGAGDFGYNTGITFTSPLTLYWYQNTGNFTDASKWFLGSGGTGGAGRIPLPQDTARFDANSFSTSGRSVDMTTTYLAGVGTIDCTGATNSPSISVSRVYGSIVVVSGMTVNGSLNLYGHGTRNITTGGVTFPNVICDGIGGSTTLQDNFTGSSALVANNGTFNANNKNITAVSFIGQSNGTVTFGNGTHTLSGTSYPTLSLTNVTISATTCTFKFTGNGSAANGMFVTGTIYNVWIATTGTGTFAYSGNSVVNNLKIDAGRSIILPSNYTPHITTWDVNGTAGNLTKFRSENTSQATLVKDGGGVLNGSYMDMDYITGSPANTFYFDVNSLDGGHNVNLIFAPKTNFFMMFK